VLESAVLYRTTTPALCPCTRPFLFLSINHPGNWTSKKRLQLKMLDAGEKLHEVF
jgi:hypothetical protein